MRLAHPWHACSTDAAHGSEYARSGEEAGFTASRKSGHVSTGRGAKERSS